MALTTTLIKQSSPSMQLDNDGQYTITNHIRFYTFVEAFLTVHDGYSLMGQTGGSVKLTVVLVEFAVRSTHRFVMWFAAIQALTFSFTCFLVNHTVLPQTTVLMFTGPRITILTKEPCKERRNYNITHI